MNYVDRRSNKEKFRQPEAVATSVETQNTMNIL